MSADAVIREGWARYFMDRGMRVIRCAGPTKTTCALERSACCPLQDDADVAYYDSDSVTDELAVHLLMQRRGIPITFARDRASDGSREPVPVRLSDPRVLQVPEDAV